MHDVSSSIPLRGKAATAGGERFGQLGKGLIGALLLAWPVAMYWLHEHVSPGQMLAGLLLLLGLRSLLAVWLLHARTWYRWATGPLLLLAGLGVLLAGEWVRLSWLRLYPALFDLAVAGVFLGSLASERSLIERIAQVFHREPLSANTARYARHVTRGWGVLMILIALVSVYTALAGSMGVWSLFNGVLVYLVMGTAFAGEYLLRRHLKRRWGEA